MASRHADAGGHAHGTTSSTAFADRQVSAKPVRLGRRSRPLVIQQLEQRRDRDVEDGARARRRTERARHAAPPAQRAPLESQPRAASTSSSELFLEIGVRDQLAAKARNHRRRLGPRRDQLDARSLRAKAMRSPAASGPARDRRLRAASCSRSSPRLRRGDRTATIAVRRDRRCRRRLRGSADDRRAQCVELAPESARRRLHGARNQPLHAHARSVGGTRAGCSIGRNASDARFDSVADQRSGVVCEAAARQHDQIVDGQLRGAVHARPPCAGRPPGERAVARSIRAPRPAAPATRVAGDRWRRRGLDARAVEDRVRDHARR